MVPAAGPVAAVDVAARFEEVRSYDEISVAEALLQVCAHRRIVRRFRRDVPVVAGYHYRAAALRALPRGYPCDVLRHEAVANVVVFDVVVARVRLCKLRRLQRTFRGMQRVFISLRAVIACGVVCKLVMHGADYVKFRALALRGERPIVLGKGVQLFRCRKLIQHAVFRAEPAQQAQICVRVLHVEAVEVQLFALRRAVVVCAHPLYELFHLARVVNGEGKAVQRLRRRARAALDVFVHPRGFAEVGLQREGAHAVFLRQPLQHIAPQTLELGVAMRGLAQRDDPGPLTHGQSLDGGCIRVHVVYPLRRLYLRNVYPRRVCRREQQHQRQQQYPEYF